MFQSAPGVNAGRYRVGPAAHRLGDSFNPLPALMPGDTWGIWVVFFALPGFNPLPALMPGDTAGQMAQRINEIVSIRSRR